MDGQTLQDELTLGDVDKNLSSKRMSNKMKIIIFGSIGAALLLILIILIILLAKQSSKKNDDENEEINMDKIGEINCVYDIYKINVPVQLLSEEYQKNSVLSMVIDGKAVKYLKQYTFSSSGLHNVQIVLYEKVNLDKMFKDIYELTSVSLESDKNAEITSMQSTFEGCESLNSFNIKGFNTANIKSIRGLFNGCESLSNINLDNLDTSSVEVLRICRYTNFKF